MERPRSGSLTLEASTLFEHLFVVRGATEAEVLQKAAEHAKQHGIRQMTPELMEKVKANIRDAA